MWWSALECRTSSLVLCFAFVLFFYEIKKRNLQVNPPPKVPYGVAESHRIEINGTHFFSSFLSIIGRSFFLFFVFFFFFDSIFGSPQQNLSNKEQKKEYEVCGGGGGEGNQVEKWGGGGEEKRKKKMVALCRPVSFIISDLFVIFSNRMRERERERALTKLRDEKRNLTRRRRRTRRRRTQPPVLFFSLLSSLHF